MADTTTILSRIEAGEVIANIGQVDAPTARALDKLVKASQIAKWRGHWFPDAGAPWGIGPLKTCYGPIAARDYYASFSRRAT